MPEHPIQLRGAWHWKFPADQNEIPRRVNLPTNWPTGLETPIRLVRQFGRPPIDRGTEHVRLELHDVPGLVSASLNGLEVVKAAGMGSHWAVELIEPLLARNELVLEVDLHSVDQSHDNAPWGTIALVIVS